MTMTLKAVGVVRNGGCGMITSDGLRAMMREERAMARMDAAEKARAEMSEPERADYERPLPRECELALTVLRVWAAGEAMTQEVLSSAWITCIEGGDASADEAVELVGFRLLGPGWRRANGGEAGVSRAGMIGVDFCADGFPDYCAGDALEVDD